MFKVERLVLALGLAVAFGACAADDAETADDAMVADTMAHPPQPAGEVLSPEDQAAVAGVRLTAQQFADLAAAKAAGYARQFPEGCVQTPDGSQGFHFINDALMDDKVDLNTPELVMYEPQADGSMQLIGVDYVIPFDKWTAAEPPQVLGRPMMRNEPLSVWALHIWTHRDNPSGLFAAFNPAVSCQHAAAARL